MKRYVYASFIFGVIDPWHTGMVRKGVAGAGSACGGCKIRRATRCGRGIKFPVSTGVRKSITPRAVRRQLAGGNAYQYRAR
jgi:hypothetical protein